MKKILNGGRTAWCPRFSVSDPRRHPEEWTPNKKSGDSPAAARFAFALKIPDADSDAKHGEKQAAQIFQTTAVVRFPNVVTGDAHSGQDVVPPFPSVTLAARSPFARRCDWSNRSRRRR